MAQIQLEIVTPEKKVLSVLVDEVRSPGSRGSFGVLPGHTPFISAMEPGELYYRANGKEERYLVGGGFVEVSENKVVLLADMAEPEAEIEVEAAKRELEEAQKHLREVREDHADYQLRAARVKQAAARMAVAARKS